MSENQKEIDGKLVTAFQSGNMKALNQLVKRWHKTFCEKAYWVVKDADVAKDIAQDSWSAIINKVGTLKQPESFGSWALRIVCNKSIDWINKSKRAQWHEKQLRLQKETLVNEPEPNRNTELKAKLLEAFKMLPPNQQIVIRLFYTENYSLKEISKTLYISVGTVKSRLFHAREKLKQLLKHYDYEN